MTRTNVGCRLRHLAVCELKEAYLRFKKPPLIPRPYIMRFVASFAECLTSYNATYLHECESTSYLRALSFGSVWYLGASMSPFPPTASANLINIYDISVSYPSIGAHNAFNASMYVSQRFEDRWGDIIQAYRTDHIFLICGGVYVFESLAITLPFREKGVAWGFVCGIFRTQSIDVAY